MAPTLYRGSRPETAHQDRARDWAEIQERMLVPLYDTVNDRLGVGPGTGLLALNCGSGLALLLAAARGAAVTGYDADPGRLRLAAERMAVPQRLGTLPRGALVADTAACLRTGAPTPADLRAGGYDVVTALDPGTPAQDLRPALSAVAAGARPGIAVVLAGWGPPERCSAARVLAVAARLAEPRGQAAPGIGGRDDLEDLARGAGLRPDGSGRVSCPFGYQDQASAVRGLLSTGLFEAAVAATDQQQVDKEIAEALHPYRRPDGTIRMENVFRYLIARV
ncbi:SAM-dependent methyltransferase [Actinacidiphila bryophytorum]|uniref:SAM-dependent methyltransferase n=1 Tax=Actinacidiphila bryophytorum TaxID=1436133 RepID=UPI002176C09D|nr:SAM-dependent methyltransferase [Actinacidiphila bryophytorum]UWE11961.1 SAM-dependent methyltransferase [Actinacidiphila bryophytorum]